MAFNRTIGFVAGFRTTFKEISGDEYDAGIAVQAAKTQPVPVQPAQLEPVQVQPAQSEPVQK